MSTLTETYREDHPKRSLRVWEIVDRLWPIFVGIIGLVFFLGGRLESPEAKQERIKANLTPIIIQFQNLDSELKELKRIFESRRDLLTLMDERMRHVQRDLKELEEEVSNLPR